MSSRKPDPNLIHPSINADADPLTALCAQMQQCRLCAAHLEPRPVFRLDSRATILVAGQAPGRRVHASGIPFDDPSGERLRAWMGIDAETFYDVSRIAILPMGLCYPGTGSSGDLPPRPECAATWRQPVLELLPNLSLTLAIGQYAIDWHLGKARGRTLTERVQAWRELPPEVLALPHPSPRNNRWLARNPWFEAELVPELQRRVVAALVGSGQG